MLWQFVLTLASVQRNWGVGWYCTTVCGPGFPNYRVCTVWVCVWRMAYDSGHSIVGYVRGWQCVGTLTNAGAIVACQLEARLALAGERAGHVNAAVLAVPVPTLIDVWQKWRGKIQVNCTFSSILNHLHQHNHIQLNGSLYILMTLVLQVRGGRAGHLKVHWLKITNKFLSLLLLKHHRLTFTHIWPSNGRSMYSKYIQYELAIWWFCSCHFKSVAAFYQCTLFPLCGIHSGTGKWMSPLYWCNPDWVGSRVHPVHTHPNLCEHQNNSLWVTFVPFTLFLSYLLLHWYFVTAAKRPLGDLWLTAWRNKEMLTVWLYAECWVIVTVWCINEDLTADSSWETA